ncbi:MAG: nucleoside deaminase [Proteobacteria bacterium]|nr:nucleoside deaminase [Pseudomonadota bacterium]
MSHETYMKEALIQAESALAEGDFPVGCVIVLKDTIISMGRRENASVHGVNEIDHAEINALKQIDYPGTDPRRKDMILYSTMEPCLMCFAAILLSGIRHIVYAYEDAMGGGTSCDRTHLSPLYRTPEIVIVPGVMRDESLSLFKQFFLSPGNRYWKGSYLEDYTLSATYQKT